MSQHSNTTTAENNTKELIMETRPEDILCGKEKHCVSHRGSLNFRLVIDQYAAKYAEAITKQEKMNVTKEIYDMLGSQNARFLKFNAKSKTKGWEELSSLLARDKISHALRFANREKKAAAGDMANPAGIELSTGGLPKYTTPSPSVNSAAASSIFSSQRGVAIASSSVSIT